MKHRKRKRQKAKKSGDIDSSVKTVNDEKPSKDSAGANTDVLQMQQLECSKRRKRDESLRNPEMMMILTREFA